MLAVDWYTWGGAAVVVAAAAGAVAAAWTDIRRDSSSERSGR